MDLERRQIIISTKYDFYLLDDNMCHETLDVCLAVDDSGAGCTCICRDPDPSHRGRHAGYQADIRCNRTRGSDEDRYRLYQSSDAENSGAYRL